MLNIRINYLLLAFILFLIELSIVLFIDDKIVRPYIGDFLVIFFLYCFFQSFHKFNSTKLSMGILVFSAVIEILQYFKLIYLLGWSDSFMAKIILGNKFCFKDIMLYVLAVVIILFVENRRTQKARSKRLTILM
ncbi:MAG: DUF2809 domain-containing protein [Bacteroidetes bacterium]|nr:DUF2809 domain-containing protein [Bacteroidota bacterium]